MGGRGLSGSETDSTNPQEWREQTKEEGELAFPVTLPTQVSYLCLGGPSAYPAQGALPARVPKPDLVYPPSTAASALQCSTLYLRVCFHKLITISLSHASQPQTPHIPEMTQTQTRPHQEKHKPGSNRGSGRCLQSHLRSGHSTAQLSRPTGSSSFGLSYPRASDSGRRGAGG